jgi:hypothetical protein
MVKKSARSTVTLRGIQHLQDKLSELRALEDSVKDNRKLVPEAVKILQGGDLLQGEHTASIYHRLIRFVELEIEAEWDKYLKQFRQEQDRGDGQIAAAWPNEEG